MRAHAVLLSFILISAVAGPGWTSPRSMSGRPGIVPGADAPQILAFDVTPKTLKKNRINFAQLYFKFFDGMANLKKGILNINFIYKPAAGKPMPVIVPVSPAAPDGIDIRPGAASASDGGRTPFVTYALKEPVFGKKTGEFKLWFGILGEDFSSVEVFIWLKDSGGAASSESRRVTLIRSTQSSGPKQGRQVGQLAYDFTLLDQADNRKTLSNFRGKVVLIDFSTMWCGPCRIEAGELQGLYLKYRKRGFIILNVLCEDPAHDPIRTSDCKTWAGTYGMTFPVLADLFWGVFDPYHAFPYKRNIPDNFLIDKTGKIRWRHLGYSAAVKSQMEAKIQQLLAE